MKINTVLDSGAAIQSSHALHSHEEIHIPDAVVGEKTPGVCTIVVSESACDRTSNAGERPFENILVKQIFVLFLLNPYPE